MRQNEEKAWYEDVLDTVGNVADVVVGDVLIAGPSYLLNRIKAMPIVGLPFQGIEAIGEYIGEKWEKGAQKAAEDVSVARTIRGIEALKKAGTSLSISMIREIATQHGCDEVTIERLIEMANEEAANDQPEPLAQPA